MRLRLVLLALTAGLVFVPAAEAIVPTPVITSSRADRVPAAGFYLGDEIILYSRNRPNRPSFYDGWLKRIPALDPSNPTTIRLNTSGEGFAGGMDGSRIVYQQISGYSSNLKFYDLATGTRSDPPAGVNTSQWEYGPTISGEWLLFERDPLYANVERIVLHNLTTGEERVLMGETRRRWFMVPGQVAGNWAVWMRCADVCKVFVHDIAADKTTTLPAPAFGQRQQYAPSVTSAGVVYAARSGNGCGTNAKIVRFRRAGDPATGTVLARLPRGIDFFGGYAREATDGSVDYFFDRWNCRAARNYDIYKVRDPAP